MEPEAYTVGWQPFLGLKIWLDSRPLIPRPETEWWVEQLLLKCGTRRVPHFLDLCAGSGAIGCAALKYLPEAEVWFGEIDPAHEATIKKNIEANGLDEKRAHIMIGDLFDPFVESLTFNILAANPPYVPEARELPSEVAAYEPALALRAGPRGLDVIRRIASELPVRLAPGGLAWIECDTEHAGETRRLFEAAALRDLRGLSLPTRPPATTEIMHDQYDRPRIVAVSWQ